MYVIIVKNNRLSGCFLGTKENVELCRYSHISKETFENDSLGY